MTDCRFERVVIAAADAHAVSVYEAICGCAPVELADEHETLRLRRFRLENASIDLAEALQGVAAADGGEIGCRIREQAAGVVSIGLAVSNPGSRSAALDGLGIRTISRNGQLYLHSRDANGVLVCIAMADARSPAGPIGDARLDHVALRVGDLDAAARRWAAITGAPARPMGIHPISGGAFSATRFVLGERMIELLSPTPGIPSPMAERLASHGEGIAALALPANDIEATLARLRAIGARVLWQAPHWMVHPKDAGGFMVQLTPRVQHD